MATSTESPDPDITTLTSIFQGQKTKALELRAEGIKNRLTRLKKLQRWIEHNSGAIQRAIYKDFKKSASEVDITEIYPVLTELKHAQKNLKDWARSRKVDAPLSYLGTTSHIQYEPKGTCLIISPWNYPFNLAIGPLISALAAGNTAILKPSEITPHTSDLIEKMIGELFPEDEVAVFLGGKEVAQALLKQPFDHIFFTGSPQVGKVVMEAAAEHLASITLELGGKSPTIIDSTANLKDTAEKIVWGKFLNAGQTCLAPDYILVEKGLKDKLVDLLKSYVRLLYDKELTGIATSPDYTRIVNEHHFRRMQKLIKDALDKGAKLEMGGKSNPEDNFVPPTIFTDVPESAAILEEEIFGPILPIVEFESLDEAIVYINERPKPLALYYFGQSNKNKKLLLHATSSGGVCINESVIHFGHTNLPLGGVNNSGIGKSHGYYGFLAFSNDKAVLKQRVGLTSIKALYPPYTNRVKKLISAMMRYF